ncbi:hypothetical protein RT723_03015, partial [Psychrosphaera aquimarina]
MEFWDQSDYLFYRTQKIESSVNTPVTYIPSSHDYYEYDGEFLRFELVDPFSNQINSEAQGEVLIEEATISKNQFNGSFRRWLREDVSQVDKYLWREGIYLNNSIFNVVEYDANGFNVYEGFYSTRQEESVSDLSVSIPSILDVLNFFHDGDYTTEESEYHRFAHLSSIGSSYSILNREWYVYENDKSALTIKYEKSNYTAGEVIEIDVSQVNDLQALSATFENGLSNDLIVTDGGAVFLFIPFDINDGEQSILLDFQEGSRKEQFGLSINIESAVISGSARDYSVSFIESLIEQLMAVGESGQTIGGEEPSLLISNLQDQLNKVEELTDAELQQLAKLLSALKAEDTSKNSLITKTRSTILLNDDDTFSILECEPEAIRFTKAMARSVIAAGLTTLSIEGAISSGPLGLLSGALVVGGGIAGAATIVYAQDAYNSVSLLYGHCTKWAEADLSSQESVSSSKQAPQMKQLAYRSELNNTQVLSFVNLQTTPMTLNVSYSLSSELEQQVNRIQNFIDDYSSLFPDALINEFSTINRSPSFDVPYTTYSILNTSNQNITGEVTSNGLLFQWSENEILDQSTMFSFDLVYTDESGDHLTTFEALITPNVIPAGAQGRWQVELTVTEDQPPYSGYNDCEDFLA